MGESFAANYDEWEQQVPEAVRADSLWRMNAYRLALFAGDLGWQDATTLLGDRRTMALADQLYRAVGSIAANLAEGYSRGTGKDRARFYEYALGSAREARDWYYKGRHILGPSITDHRINLLTQIIRLLLAMVPNQRGRTLRDNPPPTEETSALPDSLYVSRPYIHPTASVSPDAVIGAGCKIWNWAQIREGARLGEQCIVSKGVYIDAGVQIGSRVKIQNNVSVYHGVTLEDGVFVGPHVCFTNDRLPRAVNADGSLKGEADWQVSPTLVRSGASLGAHSVILPGLTIGRWALVGAGAVVTHSVPDHGLVLGNPGRPAGFVCRCATRLVVEGTRGHCPACGAVVELS